MELHSIFSLAAAAAFFFAALGWYMQISRRETSDAPFYLRDTFLPFLSLSFLLAVLLWFFNRGNADFLFPLPWFKLPLPFIAAALIYLGGSLRPNLWRQPLLIAVLAAAAVIIGAYPLTPLPGYPAWLNQAILAGILFVSSYAFKYFNGIDGIAAVITQPILWGIFFLAWIGAAPLFYGWLALGMALILLAFLAYNWYPAQISVRTSGWQATGFILGWLSLQCAAEGSGPCMLIFAMLPLTELVVALLKKLTFLKDYRNIIVNTFYFQTNISGLSPADICRSLLRIEALLVILGCFELYAPNAYSLPILCFIITLWFLNRLLNWQTPDQSLRDINREVITDIKKTFNKDDGQP